jgi:hypothetical protein
VVNTGKKLLKGTTYMTLLSTMGFQPKKLKEMIAPISLNCADITIVIPVKNNQKGITLFLSEFLKTHSPAIYPKEIIVVDNASQPPIVVPKKLYGKGNKIISRLYALDLAPRIFQAKQPSVCNWVLSRIQYLCLSWGYKTKERRETLKGNS